ncbi:MAG: alcohol dehydrogenase catalytic domain-containing protein [Chloroflexi bacterium]|nr:alcohol dehydrogenase catalytic domain-containing protein [Chloroflexota bacterium]MCI0576899.1 alcohol dehydrogenase catalytic domain-containing protein [Chloroflexota bacterium]MCI0646447.1 alcohol dehydrogenase catalytic domain-containing protein [Chloroflexota bacterium]MCI0729932.1 alcohol dehydrogenase catalytic domain-containing protein [Chloroflexota bacterium]
MAGQMKAAVLAGIEKIEIRQVAMPEVTAGTVLIKVLACGVCGSDIRIFHNGHKRVSYPAITGHEIAGEVVAVGPGVDRFRVGDQVSLGADVPCGECEWCQNGLGNCCQQNYAIGHQFPGGFAEYCLLGPMTVRYGPVRRIPAGVDVEQAALAEPLACCINGLERVAFAPGRSVVIIGAGPIGMMLAQAARAFGSPLIVLCDVDERRLEMARLAGATYYLNTAANDITTAVLDITNGRGADAVFTACPSPEAQEDALRIVGTRGAVNFFGGLPGPARPIQLLSNVVHYKEITVTGSHGSTPRQHALAVDLIAGGRVDLSGMITHRFVLDEIRRAFQVVEERAGLKVMVKPNG